MRHVILLYLMTIGCSGGKDTDSGPAGTDSIVDDTASHTDDTDQSVDTALPGDACAFALSDLKTVRLEPGTFSMGSPEDEIGRDEDEHQMEVTLTHAFEVGIYEVTLGQWRSCMDYEPVSERPNTCTDDCPAETVSWWEAAKFTNHLSIAAGLDTCYTCFDDGAGEQCVEAGPLYDCDGYRLLTQAEWEYAARAGTNSAYNAGGDLSDPTEADLCAGDVELTNGEVLDDYAWYCGNNNEGPSEVGQLLPNAWGIYDMHGNVWEWTNDWGWEYDGQPKTDPTGPESGIFRLRRGSSFWGTPGRMRSALRVELEPKISNYNIGFRVGRVVD